MALISINSRERESEGGEGSLQGITTLNLAPDRCAPFQSKIHPEQINFIFDDIIQFGIYLRRQIDPFMRLT